MIEIRIRDDKTCAVVDLNSYKNECAKVEGLSPEQAAAVKQMLAAEFQKGQRSVTVRFEHGPRE
ncbi:MAG: hypothetical protein WA416_18135 [Candidatus Sulfotelmatobacter sp.]